jgi:hypothetical protein
MKMNNGDFLFRPRHLIETSAVFYCTTSGPPGGLLKLIDTSEKIRWGHELKYTFKLSLLFLWNKIKLIKLEK